MTPETPSNVLNGLDLPETRLPLPQTVKSESPEASTKPRVLQMPLGNSSMPAMAAKAKQSKSRRSSVDKPLISTSSPEGIAAASQITPNRIANILLQQGPLPIRHLTGHLTDQVPAFGQLSLSKQRRLIMSCLESGDLATNCVFEKIGWGQWQAQEVSQEEVQKRIDQQNPLTSEVDSGIDRAVKTENNNLNSNNNMDAELVSPRSHAQQKPSTKKPMGSRRTKSASVRRESITEPTIKMPVSPTMTPLANIRQSLAQYAPLDEAIESSSSFSDDDLAEEDSDVEMYSLNQKTSAQQARRPSYSTGFFPRMLHPRSSSTSTSMIKSIGSGPNSRRASFVSNGVNKPIVKRPPRSSFNASMVLDDTINTPIDGSINSVVADRRVSFSSANQSFLRHGGGGGASNENAILDDDEESDTDEEDWKSMGVGKLKTKIGGQAMPGPNSRKADEDIAISALMDIKRSSFSE